MTTERFVLETRERYRGYEYVVILTRFGHRCGYVRVSENGVGSSIDQSCTWLDCHGGITYADWGLPLEYGSDEWWIGFDCMHWIDDVDVDATKKAFELSEHEIEELIKRHEFYQYVGVVRSNAYVQSECRRIIDQIVE